MNEFGERLRACRKKSALTQERLGSLLGEELGDRGFSGAAISDWERGVSKIHADNRMVLISLVKVLLQQGGLASLTDINELLEAGNYRALDAHEQQQIFPDKLPILPITKTTHHTEFLVWAGLFSIPSEELHGIVNKAQNGPPPAWPRIMTALLRHSIDRINAARILTFIVWIWIWLAAWALIVPSWHWPFVNRENALWALVWYSAGAIIVPSLIATMTSTTNNSFWLEHGISNKWITRLYTHQGAGIGFHVGYFAVLIINLFRYNLGIPSAPWFELLTLSVPIILSSAGARLVPHNLLLAYKKLRLADGAIFFIFFFVGPVWGFFLFDYYPIVLQKPFGLALFLLAATILTIGAVIKNIKENKRASQKIT